jgi:drug/metabolite transporter (DMT)-like permease
VVWLLITIAAYFFGAITHLFDKYLLKQSRTDPGVLTFYVGLLGIIGIVLAPWGLQWVGWLNLAIDLFAGAAFLTAILFFFYALNRADVSKVASLVGGLTPVFILILVFIIKKESLSPAQILSFCLIVAGSFLISLEKKRGKILLKGGLWLAIISAFLFSVSHLLSQAVYLKQGFISGFVLARIGGCLGALALLLWPQMRNKLLLDLKKPRPQKALIFFVGQTCGALNFILFNFAFTIGPIALISALQGTQYVFLFLMVLFLSQQAPNLIKEKINGPIILQKIISVLLIAVGIGILALRG